MSSRLIGSLAIVSLAAVGLSGCVSYGNTHALVTPVGGIGYHTFKPSQPAHEIRLPQQRQPDQIAAVQNAKAKQEAEDDRT